MDNENTPTKVEVPDYFPLVVQGHYDFISPESFVDVPAIFIALVSTVEREVREETCMWHDVLEERKLHIRDYMALNDFNRDYSAYELIDPDKDKPEWQKRRNASARAKQALIDKMKARRNAR